MNVQSKSLPWFFFPNLAFTFVFAVNKHLVPYSRYPSHLKNPECWLIGSKFKGKYFFYRVQIRFIFLEFWRIWFIVQWVTTTKSTAKINWFSHLISCIVNQPVAHTLYILIGWSKRTYAVRCHRWNLGHFLANTWLYSKLNCREFQAETASRL